MRSLAMMMAMVCTVSVAQAYVIQGVDMKIEYWAGTGANECVVAIDWNSTNGPYVSEFHVFGYRWNGSKTVAEALSAIDAAGPLDVVTNPVYGPGFIDSILYNQTFADGDNHTNVDYTGWWWCGQTQNGGKTWNGNAGGITEEYLWNGGIEGINIDGYNWGSTNMTIPEPATLILMAFGVGLFTRKKA